MKKKLIVSLLMVSIFFTMGMPAIAANTVTAKRTSSIVLVNGQRVEFDAYNINNNNYFKLRDIAFAFSGTNKPFDVGWDSTNNAILLMTGKPYTVVGGEMTGKGSADKAAVPASSRLFIDGVESKLTAYNIEGNNYFMLRDIGAALDFSVEWGVEFDSLRDVIRIDTSVKIDLSNRGIGSRWLAEMAASGEIPANTTHLNLSYNLISDLSPLSNLKELTDLDISGNQFNNIVPIVKLTKIKNLRLGHNSQFNGDLTPLGNLLNLEFLSLHGREMLNYSPLGQLVNLNRLELWNVSELKNLSFLNTLVNLTHLIIQQSANINDFSPLSNLSNLTSFSLNYIQINDISQLPFNSLLNLTELHLGNAKITDISGLCNFTFSNLKILDLGGNQITDILPLYNFTNLSVLFLGGNPLSQKDIDSLRANLYNTYIIWDDHEIYTFE